MFSVRLLGLFPAKTGSFRPFSLGPQLGGLGKPRIFLPQHLQPDLVRLELFHVARSFINQDTALLQTHSRFKVPLALGGLVAAVMPPVFFAVSAISYFSSDTGVCLRTRTSPRFVKITKAPKS